MKIMRWTLLVLVMMLASGCALMKDSRSYQTTNYETEKLPSTFTVTSWNVWKGKRPQSAVEVRQAVADSHLVLLQEFRRSLATDAAVGVEFGRSWAPFMQPHKATGVAILSKIRPRTTKALPAPWHEGFLLTPKMSLAAYYPLADTELLVINVQAIEFQAFLTYKLRDQIERLLEVADQHEGPVLIAGDFASWREDRLKAIRGLLIDYREVTFEPDTRGPNPEYVSHLQGSRELPVDHIFVRGLDVVSSSILETTASDHDALVAELRYAK